MRRMRHIRPATVSKAQDPAMIALFEMAVMVLGDLWRVTAVKDAKEPV